jgi:glyoxylase-like metal-dependent hydrolase (beta-lactamase superfamily II)
MLHCTTLPCIAASPSLLPQSTHVTAPLPPTLFFPHPVIPAPGRVIEVAPGVCWLRMPLPFALDHINLWLLADEIDGAKGWTAVDCGFGNAATRALWETHFAENFGGLPLLRVVATHYHPDHMGNAAWLLGHCAGNDPLLWATQSEFQTAHLVWNQLVQFRMEDNAAFFRRHGMPESAAEHQAKRGNLYRSGVPELPPRYRRIVGGDTLSIGGREWSTIIGLGHAPEHVSFYCRELNVLISGDMLLPKISTNVSVWANDPDGDPLRLFLNSIAGYTALPDDALVLPSHGLPFVGIRARVKALSEHHSDRLAELQAAASAPVTAHDLLPVLFKRTLDAQQQFFAMGEAIAHLNHLWHHGRLRRAAGPDGVVRFSSIPHQE